MPRKQRMYVPGYPFHVVQRGNNRAQCFFRDADYRFYLSCLGEACERYGAQLHAYVLMTNHVHLLLTPIRDDAVSRVMQSLGRRYVQFVNVRNQRTGTLWESRHKANLVDADAYLLMCYRYIELNPVRAGMVDHPAKYAWSSYGYNAFGKEQPILTEHATYQALGDDQELRRSAYRALFSDELKESDLRAIRLAGKFGSPLGDERFRQRMEGMLGRKLGLAQRGRPPRASRR